MIPSPSRTHQRFVEFVDLPEADREDLETGYKLMQEGAFGLAIDFFEKAREAFPQEAEAGTIEACRSLGNLHQSRGENIKAIEAYAKAGEIQTISPLIKEILPDLIELEKEADESFSKNCTEDVEKAFAKGITTYLVKSNYKLEDIVKKIKETLKLAN